MTLDIKHLAINTLLAMISKDIIEEYGLVEKQNKDNVLTQIRKGIYRFPQGGKLPTKNFSST